MSQPWPAQTMLDVGVPFFMLHDSYSHQMNENTATGGVDITMRYVTQLFICFFEDDECVRTSNTHLAVNFHHLCRLKWLASISEVLELWVSAAIISHRNSSMIRSDNLRYSGSTSSEVGLFCVFHKLIPPCFRWIRNLIELAFFYPILS